MSRPTVARNVAFLLALAAGAVAAQPADAWNWRAWRGGNSGTSERWHWRRSKGNYERLRLAKGAPIQIPIMDGDLQRSSVTTQFAMTQIGAQLAHTVSTGAGIKVAILDGGFDLRHEALEGHVAPGGWDTLGDDADAQDLGNGMDDDLDGNMDGLVGHGTFVASLVLAVAPDAQVIPIRVLDDEGWGTEMSVALGIQRAIEQGADVINMSLVVPDASFILNSALRQAANAGILVVGAAGNGPSEWNMDPDLTSRVLAVGAVDQGDMRCAWSYTGAAVDIYAPGMMVVGAFGGAVPNSYAYWSGTSFATGIVSGAAALVLSDAPWMMPEQATSHILDHVDPAFDVQPWWRGRIDVGEALLID